MSKKTNRRTKLDLKVNILAEEETTLILQMLKQISEKLGLNPPSEEDLQTLIKKTNVDELSRKLKNVLPPK